MNFRCWLRFHIIVVFTVLINFCHVLVHDQALAQVVDSTLQLFDLDTTFHPQDSVIAPSRQALKEILPLLVKDDSIAQDLGFSNKHETNPGNARIFIGLPNEVDLPYLVFEIYLEHIKNLTSPPPGFGESLLRPTTQLLIPISVGHPDDKSRQKVVSSLSLRLFVFRGDAGRTKKMEVRRWGSKTLIQALTRARLVHEGGKGTFLVQIPGLNRDYLGYLNMDSTDPASRGLHLITLFRDQYFAAGVDKPAREILKVLVNEAKIVGDAPG